MGFEVERKNKHQDLWDQPTSNQNTFTVEKQQKAGKKVADQIQAQNKAKGRIVQPQPQNAKKPRVNIGSIIIIIILAIYIISTMISILARVANW